MGNFKSLSFEVFPSKKWSSGSKIAPGSNLQSILIGTSSTDFFLPKILNFKGVAHDVRGFWASFVNGLRFRCITSGSH